MSGCREKGLKRQRDRKREIKERAMVKSPLRIFPAKMYLREAMRATRCRLSRRIAPGHQSRIYRTMGYAEYPIEARVVGKYTLGGLVRGHLLKCFSKNRSRSPAERPPRRMRLSETLRLPVGKQLSAISGLKSLRCKSSSHWRRVFISRYTIYTFTNPGINVTVDFVHTKYYENQSRVCAECYFYTKTIGRLSIFLNIEKGSKAKQSAGDGRFGSA